MEEIKEKIRDMEDKIRRYKICLILVPSEKKQNREEKIFKDIIVGNCLELIKAGFTNKGSTMYKKTGKKQKQKPSI